MTGIEVNLYARIDKKESETNLLNARGITTVFNSYGTGFKMWGNRNASFPNNTHISNFEVANRTGDILDESIRRLALQYADLPVDEAFLDNYLASIEVYFGTLKSIVGYSVQLDPDADLVDAFSKAQIPLMYDYTMTYQVNSIKQVIDGKEVLFYNAFSNQYRVAGEDVLSKFRTNIGG